MTEREVFELALHVMRNQGDIGVDEWIATKKAIEEVLARPERKPDPCIDGSCDCCWKHLDEPEQEPVARVQFAGGLWKVTLLTAVKKLERSNTHALYTTQPQRTWVGLTGLEQKGLMAMSARDAVFATEAKLKEKNT